MRGVPNLFQTWAHAESLRKHHECVSHLMVRRPGVRGVVSHGRKYSVEVDIRSRRVDGLP